MSDETLASTRRRLLRTGAALGVAGVAGCIGGGGDADGTVTMEDFRGSGPMVESRPAPGGTSIDDLPELSGTLTLYLGGGEGGLYLDLVELFEQIYPDFEVRPKPDESASLANTIITEQEAGSSPADVFLSIDAGSLGMVANAGATTALPDDLLGLVPDPYQDPKKQWVGVAGRARSIPYNTNQFSAADVPDTVEKLPESSAFAGTMGWAPAYGAFQSFVTAMRVMWGEDRTKSWLQGMLDQNVSRYKNEFLASNAVADGEVGASFANHYYALRVQAQRPEAPIELAFTRNDPGALVNVSGATVIEGTDQKELSTNFVRHLLSAEAQEFFATRAFSYPMIPDVQPVGGLPSIDELHPPDFNLEKLADVEPTLDLMREVGVL